MQQQDMWSFVDLLMWLDVTWCGVIELNKLKPAMAPTLYTASLCIFTAVALKKYLPHMHKRMEKCTKNIKHKSILKK